MIKARSLRLSRVTAAVLELSFEVWIEFSGQRRKGSGGTERGKPGRHHDGAQGQLPMTGARMGGKEGPSFVLGRRKSWASFPMPGTREPLKVLY